MFDIQNVVLDRVYRGIMFNPKTKERQWSISQIEDASLTMGADESNATDALGAKIMSFDRAKTAEFSGTSSLLSLELLAAQSGTTKSIASSTNKFNVPALDNLTATVADKVTLSHTPVVLSGMQYGCNFVYRLNGDGTLGEKFEVAAAPGAGKFTVTGNIIEFAPGTAAVGDEFFAYYEYEANGDANNGAIEIENSAANFPKAGEFVMESFVYDVCDPTMQYFALFTLLSSKLDSSFELGFKTDSKHPFKLKAMQSYCDKKKRLWRLVIPELGIAV